MITKLKAVLVIAAATLLIQGTAFAADEHNVSTGITAAGVPLGLHGVDAVALTSLGAVAEGTATYTVVHEDVAYYFASQKSADLFSANPGKYAPQYGGFCAYAVAKGKKFDGDPRFADIVDGKLYLFVNGDVFKLYKADSENILRKAEKTWPSIKSVAVGDL